jgi:hypothetical protein
MQFVISMLINPAVLDALTDEEKAAIGDGHGKFMKELKTSGELITTQALAARIPDAAIDGLGVEVRQVMFSAGQLEA